MRDFSTLGSDNGTVAEHVWLAAKAGLLDASFLGDSPASGECMIKRLTPAGHDFLAQAREPVLWNRAKDEAKKAGVGVTVEVMKTLLSHFAIAAITARMTTP